MASELFVQVLISVFIKGIDVQSSLCLQIPRQDQLYPDLNNKIATCPR